MRLMEGPAEWRSSVSYGMDTEWEEGVDALMSGGGGVTSPTWVKVSEKRKHSGSK